MNREVWGFHQDLTREWAEAVDDMAEAVAGIGQLMLRGIVYKSPVDTGRFRGNWITSVGAISTDTTEATDKSGEATIAKGYAVLDAYPATMPPIHIQNNLPYAARLENGWSKQAPAGMVGLTIAEINAVMPGREV